MNPDAPNAIHLTYSDDLEEAVLGPPESPLLRALRELLADAELVRNNIIAMIKVQETLER